MSITSLAGLKAKIEEAVSNSLGREVEYTVEVTMSNHIQTDVYDVYPSPHMYERRSSNGFGDVDNIVGEVSGTVLSVSNEALPNPDPDGATTNKDLSAVIEYGSGYDWPGEGEYSDPRPFLKNTVDELRSRKLHVQALKIGLKRQGLNVK